MRPMPLLVLAIALVLALAACGEDSSSKKVQPLGDDTESSASPDPGATGSPSPAATPFDDQGNDALRGKIEASTAEENAVVDAWMSYWASRAKSYGQVKVDPDLGRYAAVSAVSDVVQYVAYLKNKKLHTVGDARYDIRDIAIKGKAATLFSCAENKSLDRYADGTPGEQPMPFFSVKGELVKNGGAWRVVSVPVTKVPTCR